MKLQLNMIDIQGVRFSDKTTITKGVLHINRTELQELLQKDTRISQVHIELAKPGEKCRIIQVCDVVEPRAKIRDSGEDFPGALGKHETVGEGSTCVLRGAAVVTSTEICGGGGAPNGEIIDMSGPAAELSPFGKTHNVVVLTYPAEGVSKHDYKIAVKIAGLKTAVYLAKAGQDLKPDETEVKELPPLSENGERLKDLPRVAYIFQVIATQHGFIPQDPVLYGSSIEKMVPTILHPNEVLDGAIVAPFQGRGIKTYSIQNNPLVKEIYLKHGKELRFTGVIVTISSENKNENERSAIMAGNLAKWVLEADGVVLTKSGGGAPELAMAHIAQRCEHLGIKTTFALWQHTADYSDAGGSFMIFNMPELDAVVSMGTPWDEVAIPSMERVIGKPVSVPQDPPISGETDYVLRFIAGAWDQLGSGRLKVALY